MMTRIFSNLIVFNTPCIYKNLSGICVLPRSELYSDCLLYGVNIKSEIVIPNGNAIENVQ